MTKICSITDCGKKHNAYGYCGLHSARFRRNGTTELKVIRKWRNQTSSGISLRIKPIPKDIKCGCGCGETIKSYDDRGRKLKYKLYHSSRVIFKNKLITDRIAESNRGQKRSEKTKNKQSELKKEFYNSGGVHPMQGKKHTDESKEKNRISFYNRKITSDKFKNTKPERFLKSILSVNGIKFESQKILYGKPDIFIKPNICIFADGCFIHGCTKCISVKNLKCEIPQHKMKRDPIVNQKLMEQGYIVIRFWWHEIKNNPMGCLNRILGGDV